MISEDTSEPPRLPSRDPAGHKGTYGALSIVGGCANHDSPMIGAPALAARAAFRTGCGIVRLAMPAPILIAGLSLEPSATGIGLDVDDESNPTADGDRMNRIGDADAIVVGPGLGSDRARNRPIAHLVSDCIGLELSTLVDADGLNALVTGEMLAKIDFARCVLTPHPGEFARLAKARGIAADPNDESERPEAAAALAHSLGCVVVLKGANTVVSDGAKSWVCNHGHACMATAGTGDVLAGVIGSLIVQLREFDLSLYDIARIGVQSHAIAGERWAIGHQADAGMLARELADELPNVISELR